MISIKLNAIIECSWPEADYSDVAPELILEDAIQPRVEGVYVHINERQPYADQNNSPEYQGGKISLPAGVIEIAIHGNTIWVQSPEGATILRIKSKNGKIVINNDECENNVCHSDMLVDGNIEICLTQEVARLIS